MRHFQRGLHRLTSKSQLNHNVFKQKSEFHLALLGTHPVGKHNKICWLGELRGGGGGGRE